MIYSRSVHVVQFMWRVFPYLVIHVGDVHYEVDIKLEVVFQYPSYDIRRDIVSRVTQMGVVIDCWTASIPGHTLALWVAGDKRCLCSREGVVHL